MKITDYGVWIYQGGGVLAREYCHINQLKVNNLNYAEDVYVYIQDMFYRVNCNLAGMGLIYASLPREIKPPILGVTWVCRNGFNSGWWGTVE